MQIIDPANAPAGGPEIGRRMGFEVTAAQLANMLESGGNVGQIAHIRCPGLAIEPYASQTVMASHDLPE
ncbi:hypothetical protein [Bradyrhizobium shewense]|uniref:hypothetical protein n=1 Tax=Bradyrhizobium shewense TaxID=1761772 RepID=UPI00101AD523|nr:hypothetical protein [Bradyrhizobium shewense]